MAKGKNQHVVKRDKGWAVRGAGNSKDTVVKRTQQEAFEAARDIARNQGSEVLIHRRDGKIREKTAMETTPILPKDKSRRP